MATTTLTVPSKKNGAHPCDCGGGEETCCGLDCLVQPRFFCGQLLTDQDLTALVNWTRDKTGLVRYRDGWGVVCGLDVRCAPGKCDSVVVTPGYAVNCCGDDIIVCSEATLDLSAACRDEEDPCADLRSAVEEKYGALAGYGALGLAGVPGAGARQTALKDFRKANPHAVDAASGGVHRPDAIENVKIVDIYIRYAEKPSEPATALGRSACREVAACEYSRTRESYELFWKLGALNDDPVSERAKRWHEGYEKCLDVLVNFKPNLTGAEVRRYLLDWLAAHPMRYFCGLQDEICGLTETELASPRVQTELLFQMVRDCRTAYLNCACFECETDVGVPLARVWLEKRERNGVERFCITAIDPYPPFRRPVQPDCWPAPLGYVNVGRAIWHRWDEVCTMLADLGVRVRREEFRTPATPADLLKALRCDLFVKCGEERIAYTFTDGPLGQRVVGFCTATGTTPPPLCPDIRLTGSISLRAGQPNPFWADVTGGDPNVTPTYNWEVSAGAISGQGTNSITFDPAGLAPNTPVTVRVRVGGYDQTCDTTRSIAATVEAAPEEPACPTITMDAPNSVPVGDIVQFTVRVTGATPVTTVGYNWSASRGTIASGQGTPSIGVDSSGVPPGHQITATVEVSGYDPRCNTTGRLSTNVIAPQARKIDDFPDPFIGTLGSEDIFSDELQERFATENARLDIFAIELQNDPTAEGHVIVYHFGNGDGTKGTIDQRASRARDYLVNRRGIDSGRIVVRIVIFEDPTLNEYRFELWLVPRGATPPVPANSQLLPLPRRAASREDDFTVIPRIGPITAQKLREAGISTFAQLAETPVERLKELTKEITGVGEEQVKEWIESAKKLAR
ncbi:MAG TPA: helix-hairpin-helix domain-containing protein [Pyrinomonadaceae bacterium]|nr:helix-hairpin-helix domain-containing protein [Pyrinomonadaceae bacterium]